MRITVVGTGYAGLVTAVGLAEFGHDVVGLDVDPAKVATLQAGDVPMYEPGLEDLLTRNVEGGRIRFTTAYAEAIPGSQAVFVAVGTPSLPDGDVDLVYVEAATREMAPLLDPGAVVVMKSTVPVGTTQRIGAILAESGAPAGVAMASNPEFLRQGAAVQDFLEPERLVIGTDSPRAEAVLRELYARQLADEVAAVFTNVEGAELIKYASNAFLAIKLSFINEIADLCEAAGATVGDVARGIGLDSRIAPKFLVAGPGFGGSCLPKDTWALLQTKRRYGTGARIVGAALEVNEERKHQMVDKVARAIERPLEGARIALLGLTFKADTDDLRSSPALDLARGLMAAGATVRAYDPQGMEGAKAALPGLEYGVDAYDAMAAADGVVIATEWKEFAALDLEMVRAQVAAPVIVDLRNLMDPVAVIAAGFRYTSVGR